MLSVGRQQQILLLLRAYAFQDMLCGKQGMRHGQMTAYLYLIDDNHFFDEQ